MRDVTYSPFFGGLNLKVPALSLQNGELIVCRNYECSPNGGYARIIGYEAFDGQTKPSSLNEADYADRAAWITAVEAARANIAAVPGIGDVLGVWEYGDTVYAFRNKTGGASAGMYKSTAAGWVEVTTGVTLSPDGRYEFVNYNFGGHAGSLKMYGCDGVNKAFQFDGTTFTQITTGMVADTPLHIFAHKNHLFLMFTGGSVQHSPIADPTGTWVLATGAGEIGLGDEGTGFQNAPGGVLVIGGANSLHVLYGSSAGATDPWQKKTFTSKTGVVRYSMQRLGEPMFLDDHGVTSLSAVDAFGDFSTTTLTQRVRDYLETKRGQLVASASLRSKDQYRLFFDDKTVLTLSFGGGKMIGASTQEYEDQVTCVSVCEDDDGQETAYFGCDDGFVYQLERGNNFNGEPIVAWLRLAFNHFKSPQNTKRFYKVVLETDVDRETEIYFYPLYDYGNPNTPDAIGEEATVYGGGGIWGEAVWNDFLWGAQLVGEAFGYIDGVGKNLSMYIKSTGTYERPHILQGALIHYSVRGLAR